LGGSNHLLQPLVSFITRFPLGTKSAAILISIREADVNLIKLNNKVRTTMKLKNILFVLSAGIGLALPAAMATAGGSCQRCEEAFDACEVNNSHDVCLQILNCRLC
jgi:hypothetical protein